MNRVPVKGSSLKGSVRGSIRVLIVRIGFWGILDYKYNKKHPKTALVIVWDPILGSSGGRSAPEALVKNPPSRHIPRGLGFGV